MGAGQSRGNAGQGHSLQMESQQRKVFQPAQLVASASDAQQGLWSHVQPQQSSVPAHSSALPGGVADSTVVSQLRETDEQMPLGYWIFREAWVRTRGTARVDLMRPRFPQLLPGSSLLHAGPAKRGRARPVRQQQFFSSDDAGPQHVYIDDDSSGLFGRSTGARVKIMRSVEIGRPKTASGATLRTPLLPQGAPVSGRSGKAEQPAPTHSDFHTTEEPGLPGTHQGDGLHHHHGPDREQMQAAVRSVQSKLISSLRAPQRPLLDLGVGFSYELDTSDASLLVRLKVKDWFSVRLLPHQVLKVNKRWQLGASPVALRVNYECPLDNLGNPLASPAKLMVRFENTIGRSVRLTPSGIDFDEHVFQLGQGTVIRAAGSVLFPRQLPVEEGEKLFNYRVQRFGLKSQW